MSISKVQSNVRIEEVFGADFEQTTPLLHGAVLRPKGEIADVSKSQGAQVVAGRSLPRVYVTSSTKVSARRSKWATVRMAPAKRKAFSPRNFGGRPCSMTS